MSKKKKTSSKEALRPLTPEEMEEVEETCKVEMDEFLTKWRNRPHTVVHPTWSWPFTPRF